MRWEKTEDDTQNEIVLNMYESNGDRGCDRFGTG